MRDLEASLMAMGIRTPNLIVEASPSGLRSLYCAYLRDN